MISTTQAINNKYFSGVAEDYDTFYWRSDEDNVTKYFFKTPGRLLIAGVGRGRTVGPLMKRGHNITGIDIAPEMIEGAKKHYNATFEVMDMTCMPFPDNTFDYVFSPFNSVTCTDNPIEAVKELRRVLKPGGTLLFQTPNQNRPKLLISRIVRVDKPGGTFYCHLLNMLDVFRFKRMFSSARVYGRMQWSNGNNWKDRTLKVLPFLDRNLYFVCVK